MKAVVIFSSGFGEADAAGRDRQAALVDIARRSGMRILGPNCLGAYNTRSRAFLTMSGLFQDRFPEPGTVGVVSQSGGYAGQLAYVAGKRGIGIGNWVTTGNEADVDMSEILLAYAEDATIATVLAYIEGIRSGPKFLEALAALKAARKPLIAFKVGSSASGSKAVASHTASMAGQDAVYDAVFAEFGVRRVQSTEEALDILYAASVAGLPRGKRFAAVSTSGGLGGQLADLAEANGLDMPQTSAPLAASLRDIAPLGSAINPIDVSGQVVNDPTIMGRSVAALGASGQYDLLHCFIGFSAGIGWLSQGYLDTMKQGAAAAPDMFKIASVSGSDGLVRQYEDMGYAVFEEPARGIRAAAALALISQSFADAGQPENGASLQLPGLGATADSVLSVAGIERPPTLFAANAAEAAAAMERLGGSVVLKIVSPDIAHKTEVGGVVLGLKNAAAVKMAAAEMGLTVRMRAPTARIAGFEVTSMLTDGIECVLAWHLDAVFGPIVTFGIGGTLVEIQKDTTIHRAPLSRLQARSMIRSLRSSKLFEGYRGTPAVDIDALTDVIVRFSKAASVLCDVMPEFEINPLLVRAGEAPVALDTLSRLGGCRHA